MTRRCERCRSGSQIPGGRIYQRQSASGRSRSMESCRLPDGCVNNGSERLLSVAVSSQLEKKFSSKFIDIVLRGDIVRAQVLPGKPGRVPPPAAMARQIPEFPTGTTPIFQGVTH